MFDTEVSEPSERCVAMPVSVWTFATKPAKSYMSFIPET